MCTSTQSTITRFSVPYPGTFSQPMTSFDKLTLNRNRRAKHCEFMSAIRLDTGAVAVWVAMAASLLMAGILACSG